MQDDLRSRMRHGSDGDGGDAGSNSDDAGLNSTEQELNSKISQLIGSAEDSSAQEIEKVRSKHSAKQAAPDAQDEKSELEEEIEEEFGPPPETSNSPQLDEPSQKNGKGESRMAGFLTLKPNLSKKQWAIYGGCLVIVIAALVASFFVFGGNNKAPLVISHTAPIPKSTKVPSKLTGLPVDPSVNQRQVTGVMIENTTFARPQSGLAKAGVVYEAIAEAGITRFEALFQDTSANYLGPVRSARPYFVEWCQAFDCALAHVGGSPTALSDINKWGVKNIDQFYGAQYYHRINARYAPHNMYTSSKNLGKYEKAKGYTSSDFTGFAHLPKAPIVNKTDVTTSSINLNYPTGSTYDVHYSYDRKNNRYLRSEAGQPHYSVDAQGHKTRIAPNVVIVLVVPYSLMSDNYHSHYDSVGSGRLYLFQNGTETSGQWSRNSRSSQFVFTDSQGQELKLDPGQTWISAVGASSDVTYN